MHTRKVSCARWFAVPEWNNICQCDSRETADMLSFFSDFYRSYVRPVNKMLQL